MLINVIIFISEKREIREINKKTIGKKKYNIVLLFYVIILDFNNQIKDTFDIKLSCYVFGQYCFYVLTVKY